MNLPVRTRIAPSPTGEPHVGTAYIGLFNLCYARKYGGQFILRIEDTDQKRSTLESEKNILECLSWLDLNWDEGPDKGGEYGPYRQSERLDIYKEYVEKLIQDGHAYYCFCSSEDLSKMREEQKKLKGPQGYMGRLSPCRELSQAEVQARLNEGTPYVVRMKVPQEDKELSFFDEVRKENISKNLLEVDDQIILKSDGFPTYHLASVVDDHLMKISHVIRGEEWINSTYKHILLYQAFGWDCPKFFHLGLLRNADANKSKISKRKNPVSLKWFRAGGFHPKALLNFLGLMGYSRYREDLSEEEKKTWEYFDLETMISDFEEKKISPTGAAFDFTKLEDMNFHYINDLGVEGYYDYLKDRLDYLREYFKGFNDLFLKRFQRDSRDLQFWTGFIFQRSLEYDLSDFQSLALPDPKEGSALLKKFKKLLSKKVDLLDSPDKIEAFVQELIPTLEVKPKLLFMLLRLVIMGKKESLPLFDAMHLLGLYGVLQRLDEGSQFLNSIRPGQWKKA